MPNKSVWFTVGINKNYIWSPDIIHAVRLCDSAPLLDLL